MRMQWHKAQTHMHTHDAEWWLLTPLDIELSCLQMSAPQLLTRVGVFFKDAPSKMIKEVTTAEAPRPQNNYIKGGGRGVIDTTVYIYIYIHTYALDLHTYVHTYMCDIVCIHALDGP